MFALLAIVGLVLIFLEFFLPGGVMAVAGGLLLVASFCCFAVGKTALLSLVLYGGLLALSLFAVIYLSLSRVKKGGVCLDEDQEGFQASVYPKEVIGMKAIVASDLKPSGYVQVEDRAFAALSRSGYIEKGAYVRILGGEGSSLIVAQEMHHHVVSTDSVR